MSGGSGRRPRSGAKAGRVSRREFLAGAAGVATGLAGTAVIRRRAAAAAAGPGAVTGWTLPAGNVQVTFWDSTSFLKTRLYNQFILPEYSRLRPNYTVRYENIDTSGLLQKLLAATATGTAPEIFELGDWFFPTYFAKSLLDPVPPAAFGFSSIRPLMNVYVPGSLTAMTHNGQLYGLPDFMASHSLYMNTRLFHDAGLDPAKDAPKTWNDVARLNRLLTKRRGDQIVQKGFEMRYAGDHWLAQTFHHLIYQAGGEILDRSGRPVFNREPGVRALQTWKTVTIAPQVTQNTGASPFQDFATEQDAMTYIGPNGGRQIEGINPKMKGNYTVAPLPQIDPARPATMTFSFDIVVNARVGQEKKRVAWDFIHTALSNPEGWLTQDGALLPFTLWMGSDEAKHELPFFDVFMHDIGIGRPMVRTPYFNEFESAIARAIQRVVYSNADPKQSLDQAADEFARASKG